MLEVLLSLHNHTDQEHFDHNQQNVLHLVLVDEVTVDETVQNALDTLEDQFVEVLILDVFLFFQFFLALLFRVFSADFDSWHQNLAQSQQDTEHDDEDHAADESEDQVERVDKLEREEDSQLETDLEREEDQVGSYQCQQDTFEGDGFFEVLGDTLQDQRLSGRFLFIFIFDMDMGTGIGRDGHFLWLCGFLRLECCLDCSVLTLEFVLIRRLVRFGFSNTTLIVLEDLVSHRKS